MTQPEAGRPSDEHDGEDRDERFTDGDAEAAGSLREREDVARDQDPTWDHGAGSSSREQVDGSDEQDADDGGESER